jgi:hypothetical protein
MRHDLPVPESISAPTQESAFALLGRASAVTEPRFYFTRDALNRMRWLKVARSAVEAVIRSPDIPHIRS